MAPRIAKAGDELLVVSASLGTKGKQKAFRFAVGAVVRQVSPITDVESACWPAATDPCLQLVDYYCWAIYRKWEKRDMRSYELIKEKIGSEFELFARGSKTYY